MSVWVSIVGVDAFHIMMTQMAQQKWLSESQQAPHAAATASSPPPHEDPYLAVPLVMQAAVGVAETAGFQVHRSPSGRLANVVLLAHSLAGGSAVSEGRPLVLAFSA